MKFNCSCVYYYYYYHHHHHHHCKYYFLAATIAILLLNVLHFLFKMQDVSLTGSLFFFRYEGGKA